MIHGCVCKQGLGGGPPRETSQGDLLEEEKWIINIISLVKPMCARGLPHYNTQTLHGTAVYAAPLTPQTTPTDRHIWHHPWPDRQSYGSPMWLWVRAPDKPGLSMNRTDDLSGSVNGQPSRVHRTFWVLSHPQYDMGVTLKQGVHELGVSNEHTHIPYTLHTHMLCSVRLQGPISQ